MKLSTLLLINAIVAVLFGLVFVLVPATAMALYGIQLSDAGLFTARLFGAALVTFAIISWLVRGSAGSEVVRSIAFSFFVGDIIGFIISFIYQLQGVPNALGWSTVVIYLLLGVGFGYLYLTNPGE